jgi:hypothetical protein
MISPGIKSLGDFTITSAATQIGDVITGLEGMLAVSISARLAWGSGGTNAKLYCQTSLDQGTTWQDCACIVFGAASETAVINLSGLTPKTTQVTPTDGSLTDDICVDGILGDRLRCKLVSTGTYAGSTVLSVRAACR